MKTTNLSARKAALACAISLIALGTAGAANPSDPSPRIDPRMAAAMERDLNLSPAQFARYVAKQRAAYDQLALAEARFGESFGGAWFERDASGEYKYIVATTSSAKQAAINGAEVRNVRHSLRQLEDAVTSLNRFAPSGVTSGALKGVQFWKIDLPSNSIVIGTTPGALIRTADFLAKTPVDASLFRFETTAGVAMTTSWSFNIFGGNFYSSTLNCSVGFPVVRAWDGTKGFVTAGHCGAQGAPVSRSGVQIGWVQGSSFPGNDYAWANVRSTDVLYGIVDRYNGTADIVQGSATADVNAPICRSGYASGFRCGTITGIGVTVFYPGGPVYNLRSSNACVTGGDSGGSWITGTQAQGVTSGGNVDPATKTNCNLPVWQVNSFYQRLNPILSAYGLNLVLY
jgi:alpha-lytic endopeptidase